MKRFFFQERCFAFFLLLPLVLVGACGGDDDKPRCRSGYKYQGGRCEPVGKIGRESTAPTKTSPSLKAPKKTSSSPSPTVKKPGTSVPTNRNLPRVRVDTGDDQDDDEDKNSDSDEDSDEDSDDEDESDEDRPYLSYSSGDSRALVQAQVSSFKKALKQRSSYDGVFFEFSGGWEIDNTGRSPLVLTEVLVDAAGTEAAGHGGVVVYGCKAKVAKRPIKGVSLSVSSDDELIINFPEVFADEIQGNDFAEIFGLGVYTAYHIREPRVRYKSRNLKTTKEKPCRRYLYKNQKGSNYEVTVIVIGASNPDTVGAGAPRGDDVVSGSVKLYPSKDKNLVAPKLDIYLGPEGSRKKVTTLSGGGLKYFFKVVNPKFAAHIAGSASESAFRRAMQQLVVEVSKVLNASD